MASQTWKFNLYDFPHRWSHSVVALCMHGNIVKTTAPKLPIHVYSKKISAWFAYVVNQPTCQEMRRNLTTCTFATIPLDNISHLNNMNITWKHRVCCPLPSDCLPKFSWPSPLSFAGSRCIATALCIYYYSHTNTKLIAESLQIVFKSFYQRHLHIF